MTLTFFITLYSFQIGQVSKKDISICLGYWLIVSEYCSLKVKTGYTLKLSHFVDLAGLKFWWQVLS